MSIYYKDEIRIILADDHEVVRVGLKRLFSIDKSIIILAEANNGKGVIELVDYYKPDIALIDILMPIMDGIEATKIIKKTVPEILDVGGEYDRWGIRVTYNDIVLSEHVNGVTPNYEDLRNFIPQ